MVLETAAVTGDSPGATAVCACNRLTATGSSQTRADAGATLRSTAAESMKMKNRPRNLHIRRLLLLLRSSSSCFVYTPLAIGRAPSPIISLKAFSAVEIFFFHRLYGCS